MKKRINKKMCDTESAKLIGTKCVGEFGQPDGYEEQLFVTKTKHYFFYGNGGPESKYPKEDVALVSDEDAAAWIKENVES